MATLPTRVMSLLKQSALTHHADTIAAGLVPAFRLVPGKRSKTVPIGASKVGGEPDLPKGAAWPTMSSTPARPYHFLAQISLAEVPHDHLRSLGRSGPRLPRKGHVYFWYNTLAERKREERSLIDMVSWNPSLLLLTNEPSTSRGLERRAWPEHKEKFKRPDSGDPWRAFPQAPLSFRPMLSITAKAINTVMNAEEAADPRRGWDRVYAFYRGLHEIRKGSASHQILGDFYEVQGNLRFDAACEAREVSPFAGRSAAVQRRIEREAAEFLLLFRLDTDERGPGWSWGDMGSLCWFIRPADLKAGKLGAAIGVYDQGC